MLKVQCIFNSILIILIIVYFTKSTTTISKRKNNHQFFIYYGKYATSGQIPFQIALYSKRKFTCGGVIISNKFILTAAHCVRKTDMIIRAGSINVTNGGQLRNVCKTIKHSNFGYPSPDYDIAIIKLCKPLKLNTYVKVISIINKEPTVNSTAQISGWGATENSSRGSEILKYANVFIKERNYCDKFARRFKQNFTERMICAEGPNNEDVCYGDSGGPLVVDGKLAGLTSWGIRCGRTGYPSMYTNVAYFRNFISKYVRI